MAVLVEGISVIIRADRLLACVPGGWEAFKRSVPNSTLCADNELVRIGFMHPDDVGRYITELQLWGLRYLVDGKAHDLVVADQQDGLLAPCDWAECGRIPWQGDGHKKITACRLAGSTSAQIIMPDGWKYEDSLSAQFRFTPAGTQDAAQLVDDNEGMQTYRNPDTNRAEYVGRIERYAAAPAREKRGIWGLLSGR